MEFCLRPLGFIKFLQNNNHLAVNKMKGIENRKIQSKTVIYIYIYIGWNDKIVILKKTTLQLYFKTFIEKINSGNLIM